MREAPPPTGSMGGPSAVSAYGMGKRQQKNKMFLSYF